MKESDKQLNPLASALSVAPEDYIMNKAKIAEAKALISAYEEMNEAGKQSHDEFARELEQKIREGEQARMLLEQLRSQSIQIPPSMPIQRPAIDYPSNTSRIEEVPGSVHSQQVHYHQFQGSTSNQQTHNSVPQATAQPVASSSYQQFNSQQWMPANAINDGRSQQTSHQLYSQYSQQNIMQNSSSRAASYAPFGFPRPQQQATAQDQGRHDNYSRPMGPTQEQRGVPSYQGPLHRGMTGPNQGQQHTATSAPQVQMFQPIPTHVPSPSSHASHTARPAQSAQQSSSTQKSHPKAAASQNQAHPRQPQPHTATNVVNQSQLPATVIAASRPVALVSQPNVPSSDDRNSSSNSATFGRPTNSVPVVVSTSPSSIPKNPQTTGQQPLLIPPTILPSTDLHPTQYIREFGDAVKSWEAKVPPNSYFDHPSKTFTVFKDPASKMHIMIRTNGQICDSVDAFCDHWLQCQNLKPSVTPTVPANSQSDSSKQTQSAVSMTSITQKAIPSTVHKAIPSTVHKATTLSKSDIQRPQYPQPGVSLSKQTQLAMSTHDQGSILLTPQIFTSQKNPSSTSQIQLPPPSTSQVRPLPAQTPPSMSVPETPSRQLSTIINGVPRSVKQADKKFLASHILFGLGKRPREPDTSPTALTEPTPKRHAQQAAGQVGVGINPSGSYFVGQAVQKTNVPLQTTPTGTPVVSSSSQQHPHTKFTPPAIPQGMLQTSQSAASTSSQQLVNVPLETAAVSTEIREASKTFPDQPSLSLQDDSIVQAALFDDQRMQVPLSVVQPDSHQETISDDRPVTSFGSSVLQPPAAASVPLATSSTLAQTAVLPLSPIPLIAPVPDSSLISCRVNETTTQSVAPSTSPLDFMAAERAQMSQKNQPLFLPSPVSSPGVDGNDDISAFGTKLAIVANPSSEEVGLRGSSKRKNRAYVLVPRRPEYLIKYWRLEKLKMSRAPLKKIRMTPGSSVSTSVVGEEDFYNAPESHSPSYAYEQQAVQLACSRLQELSCKWDGCTVKLNSVDGLIRHLNRQHKPSSMSHSNSFLCRWTQCGRRCNLHEKHLEKHAFLRLGCPYEDCEESFRSAPPLWKHMRAEHENGKLKLSAQPSYPKLKPPDDTIPGVIPSYMITTRRVNPDAISSTRHAIIGPRVLRNIAGLERERKNKSRKTIRSSNGDMISDEDTNNDYDFLTAHPIRYSSHLSQAVDMNLEDLNSENISRMVDEGLTLWGNEEDLETPIPSPCDSPTLGLREHRSDQDEVEKMLIVA